MKILVCVKEVIDPEVPVNSIDIDSNNAHTYNNRATAYSNKGEYNLTLEDCTRAIQVDNKMADAYVNRGFAKVLLGLNDDAEADFESASNLGFDRNIIDGIVNYTAFSAQALGRIFRKTTSGFTGHYASVAFI